VHSAELPFARTSHPPWVRKATQFSRAILLYGGDKTSLGNSWYPPAIAEVERRLSIYVAERKWRLINYRPRGNP